jgi:glycosyltransferase involved in cell wall biosynthesis
MIQVLLATGLYPPEIGGPATYAKMLQEDLPDHDIDLTVIPFSIVRKYPKIIRHAVYFWKLCKAAKQADIVYALDPVSVGLPAVLTAKVRSKQFVLRVGGDYAWEQGCVRFGVTETLDDYITGESYRPVAVRLLAGIQSWVARQAVAVIAPSNYLQGIIMQWGVSQGSVGVIHSTLFPLTPTTSKEQTREQLALGSPVLVTAGRLVPWKGIDAVIDVADQLRSIYPDVTLVVIGDGPERPVLESKVAKHALQKTVQFVGRQSKPQLANIIQAADVFVLNTAYEGLSHQLLEVMELGVPIVTTNVGGNPELLTDGVDATLVDFDDTYALTEACKRSINDEQYATGLVRFAKARTSDFNRTKAIDEIVTLLHQVSLLPVK